MDTHKHGYMMDFTYPYTSSGSVLNSSLPALGEGWGISPRCSNTAAETFPHTPSPQPVPSTANPALPGSRLQQPEVLMQGKGTYWKRA